MASEPDLTGTTAELVKAVSIEGTPDDDLAYCAKMLNSPQVFVPANPYIFDGPVVNVDTGSRECS